MTTNRAGRAALCGLALALIGAPAFANGSGLSGTYWKTEDDKFVFQLADCGEGEMCADLVWLLRPLDKETLRPKTDRRNSDPALRERPVCGLRLVTGLEPDGDGEWEDGRFYNPDDGNSYGASLRQRGEGDLAIRAYLGMEMLGVTMRMRPVSAPAETCEARAEAAMADVENYVARAEGGPWAAAED